MEFVARLENLAWVELVYGFTVGGPEVEWVVWRCERWLLAIDKPWWRELAYVLRFW